MTDNKLSVGTLIRLKSSGTFYVIKRVKCDRYLLVRMNNLHNASKGEPHTRKPLRLEYWEVYEND